MIEIISYISNVKVDIQVISNNVTVTVSSALVSGLQLGETDTTAYRGDRGKIAYDHSQIISANPHGTTASDIGLGNVNNTSDADKPISNDVELALDNKVEKNSAITGSTKTKITYDSKGLVTSGQDATTSDIADSVNKRYVTDAQLTLIDNTSGTNTGDNATNTTSNAYADGKVSDAITDGVTNIAPSQNAVFDALALKENTITAGTTGQYYRGDKTFQALDKAAVGLSNVDNTSDANKPISSATQTALNDKISTTDINTSAKIKAIVSDETGNGSLVFADTPTLITPILGTPTSGNLQNCTNYPANSLTGFTSTGTGTAIPLTFVGGYYGNMGSANSSTTYTTTGGTIAAFAVIRINAATQPSVTGATLIDGAAFVANIDMHLVIQYFGTSVQYYFLRL